MYREEDIYENLRFDEDLKLEDLRFMKI